jgi:hypothetical protein
MPFCRVAVVVAEHAAETFCALDAAGCIAGFQRDNQSVAKALVIPFRVVICDVLTHSGSQRGFAKEIILSRQSSLIERTNRSANAFKFGEDGGSLIASIPELERISPNNLV